MINTVDIFENFILNKGYLDKFKIYLQRIGSPQNKLKVVRVVGTNGKGSLSNYIAQILQNNNFKVGLFTSPSFYEHNERIKVNNIQISDEDIWKYLKIIKEIVEEDSINFFEIFCFIAILYFFDQKCDICVIEAGIGGFLDTTKIFENSIATLVASLSYDHQEILGTTMKEIAYQKIMINNGKEPVFISYSNKRYQHILNSIQQNLIYVDKLKISNDLFINDAASTAITFAKFFNFSIDYSIFQKNILGRMSLFKNNILLDGAHNYDGIKKLVMNLSKNYPTSKLIIVYSSINKKEYTKNINYLSKKFKNNFFISFFKHEKSISLNDIKFKVNFVNLNDLDNFVKKYNQNHLIVFCGSLYFISEVYKILNLNWNNN